MYVLNEFFFFNFELSSLIFSFLKQFLSCLQTNKGRRKRKVCRYFKRKQNNCVYQSHLQEQRWGCCDKNKAKSCPTESFTRLYLYRKVNVELPSYWGREVILTLIPLYSKAICFTFSLKSAWHYWASLLASCATESLVLVIATRSYAWFG